MFPINVEESEPGHVGGMNTSSILSNGIQALRDAGNKSQVTYKFLKTFRKIIMLVCSRTLDDTVIELWLTFQGWLL